MKEYILNLEKEFSLIENGFKEEEKRALADYLSNDNAYTKELAFLAFKSNVYQVRMYSVFLFGYLSSYEEFLIFMRDEDNPDEAIKRIATLKEDSSEYVRKSVGNALRDISKKFPELIKEELDSWDVKSKEIQKVYKLASKFIK